MLGVSLTDSVCCDVLCCPADLIDNTGSYQLVLGVDDSIQQPHWKHRIRMPRSLLAMLAVQCLLLKDEGKRLYAQHSGHNPIFSGIRHFGNPFVAMAMDWQWFSRGQQLAGITHCEQVTCLQHNRYEKLAAVTHWCLYCCHTTAGAGNRSIDCAGRAVTDASLATSSTEQVKQLLTDMPHNCDYTVNDRTQPDAVFV